MTAVSTSTNASCKRTPDLRPRGESTHRMTKRVNTNNDHYDNRSQSVSTSSSSIPSTLVPSQHHELAIQGDEIPHKTEQNSTYIDAVASTSTSPSIFDSTSASASSTFTSRSRSSLKSSPGSKPYSTPRTTTMLSSKTSEHNESNKDHNSTLYHESTQQKDSCNKQQTYNPIQSERASPGNYQTIPTYIRDGKKVIPATFENCAMDDLIVLISSMLLRLVQHNDQIPFDTGGLTRFHSRAPPGISIHDYLMRIVKYTTLEPSIALSLLPYADKISERVPNFVLSSLTVHRFIIAATSVGSKALSDSFCTSSRYARVGGIRLLEMSILERELCSVIDWRLITPVPVLDEYYASLVRAHPDYILDEPGPHCRLAIHSPDNS